MLRKHIFIITTILLFTNNTHKIKAEETEYFTDNGFYIYYENFQAKGTKYFEFKGNKIEAKGLTILWSRNVQISSKKIIVEMDDKKKSVKKISLLKSTDTYKPLIIIFKEGYPNHFSADKITLSFNTETNEIEKISMEENVESFYFITLKGNAKYITKGKFKKLEPYYNNEEKAWNVNFTSSKGELVNIEFAYKHWDNFVLKNFKIYKNDVIDKKQDLIRQKEECIKKINEINSTY